MAGHRMSACQAPTDCGYAATFGTREGRIIGSSGARSSTFQNETTSFCSWPGCWLRCGKAVPIPSWQSSVPREERAMGLGNADNASSHYMRSTEVIAILAPICLGSAAHRLHRFSGRPQQEIVHRRLVLIGEIADRNANTTRNPAPAAAPRLKSASTQAPAPWHF